eukprot:TRINITY_DN22198_c0_g1_i1.p1 TRINITY_DN22198_c0_g1~~TRINITY_DN22198_c0_g1_i1.p1  ORF type:complete len:508 (+),score=127.28 TRINITY_DN22198_c0_g1_i1:78-1526(+)
MQRGGSADSWADARGRQGRRARPAAACRQQLAAAAASRPVLAAPLSRGGCHDGHSMSSDAGAGRSAASLPPPPVCGSDAGADPADCGPPDGLHDVCRQITELVSVLVRSLSGWQQRAAADARRSRATSQVSQGPRWGPDAERIMESRLQQYSELLESEERVIREVKKRNEELERERAQLRRERAALADKVDELQCRLYTQEALNADDNQTSPVAFARFVPECPGEIGDESAFYRGLVRVFVRQLRQEKRQRLHAEEQSHAMQTEHEKTVQNMESRIKQLEARAQRPPSQQRSPTPAFELRRQPPPLSGAPPDGAAPAARSCATRGLPPCPLGPSGDAQPRCPAAGDDAASVRTLSDSGVPSLPQTVPHRPCSRSPPRPAAPAADHAAPAAGPVAAACSESARSPSGASDCSGAVCAAQPGCGGSTAFKAVPCAPKQPAHPRQCHGSPSAAAVEAAAELRTIVTELDDSIVCGLSRTHHAPAN